MKDASGSTDPGAIFRRLCLPRKIRLADEKNPLPLECGKEIRPVDVEYEVYGELNENKDNAILILHALSGDAHAPAGIMTPKNWEGPGWPSGLAGGTT